MLSQSSFSTSSYGSEFAKLLDAAGEMPLDAGDPCRDHRAALDGLTIESAFAEQTIVDPQMAALCCGGVWLRHNYLDESHRISQRIKTPSGSFWHGIMHRREGDFSNAKYWFRNVGDHPVYESLAAAAGALSDDAAQEVEAVAPGGAWDPYAFVDLCEAAVRGDGQHEPLCRAIQQREWELLFDDGYQAAIAH